VPLVPTIIELPSLTESELVKHSHKDFYNEKSQPQIQIQDQGLIQEKFNEISDRMNEIGKQRE